jgi:hypothetical protein
MLGSCAVLRLGENSSLRMVDDSLVAPRLELLGGAAVVDIPGIQKGGEIHMRLDTAGVTMARKGLYRFDYLPAQLKVFDGRAAVAWNNGNLVVAAGRMLAFGATETRFDKRGGDAFDLWSRERSQFLAQERAAQSPAEPMRTRVQRLRNGRANRGRTNSRLEQSQRPRQTTMQNPQLSAVY